MEAFALFYAIALFEVFAIGLWMDGWRGRKVTLPPLPRTLPPLPRTLPPLPRTLAPAPIKMAISAEEIAFATRNRVWAPGAPHHGLPMPRPGKPSPLLLASRRSPHPAPRPAPPSAVKGPQPRCPVTGRFVKRSAV